MKSIVFKGIFVIGMLLLISANSIASEPNDEPPVTIIQKQLNERISDNNINCGKTLKCKYPMLVTQFYADNGYQPIWTKDNELSPLAVKYINIINTSYSDGLDPFDYHLQAINKQLDELNTAKQDSDNNAFIANTIAHLELTMTDSFFLYINTLVNGRVNNRLVYRNWEIKKHDINSIKELNQAVSTQDIDTVVNNLRPPYKGYIKLQNALAVYQQIALDGGWNKISKGGDLKLGSHGDRVVELKRRLLASGELDSEKALNNNHFDHELKTALMQYQANNGLPVTGILNKETLDELNISVASRIAEIEKNLDRMRWLPWDLGSKYVWVNIPDYSLQVIESGHVIMSMKTIVGRYKHQSCVLHSKISYMELNPYWLIPHNIGVKELLPKVQLDSSFLAKNNIQVFKLNDRYYRQPIDPDTIDWNSIESKGFPYRFRQDIGADNSLGFVKFMFPNNCGIYLHDTPTRGLFNKYYRSLSHGCIRIHKPIDFATYLLKDKPNYSQQQIEDVISTKKNKRIYLTKPVDVHIVYFTAWVDDNNVLQFRPDIYDVDSKVSFKVVLPK